MAASPQALAAGAIAFVDYNADGIDSFTFVALVALPEGTVIKFTDRGWKSDNTFRTGEGVITWTAPAGGVACGGLVTITTAPSASIGTVTEEGALDFAVEGDQVIAYQASGTITPIAALNNEGAAVWQANATSTNTSALPQGLTNGSTAVALNEIDNARYNGAVTTGTAAELRAAINNSANWTGSDTVNQSFTGTFNVSGCALAASLLWFSAESADGYVAVRWETGSESGTVGYNLFRATSEQGEASRITPEPIPSQAAGGVQGAQYEWRDQDVQLGESYYYWLEEVDSAGGATRHGPASTTYQPAPTALVIGDMTAGGASRALVLPVAVALMILAAGWRRRSAA